MNNFNQKHTRVILSYYWKLRSFPDYFQQLEMESLGKPANTSSQYKNTGQVIFGGYGPKAEHSYFQFYIKELMKYVQILLLVIKIKMILNI